MVPLPPPFACGKCGFIKNVNMCLLIPVASISPKLINKALTVAEAKASAQARAEASAQARALAQARARAKARASYEARVDACVARFERSCRSERWARIWCVAVYRLMRRLGMPCRVASSIAAYAAP